MSSLFGYSQKQQSIKKDTLKTEQLEEIIISATRTIRQLSSLPLPAQIVSKKEILRSNSIRLSDILSEQTGLITVPDFGGGQGIQLQGLDSQYTLILIDGVPLVGRSAGTLDLSRVTVGNIKQIEIVKGASSSLYGNEALGGVINIITETPKTGFKGTINYRLATFNTNDTSISLHYKKEQFGIAAFVNRYHSNGYDLDKSDDSKTVDPYSNLTISTKITYNFTDKTKLFISNRYYTQQQEYLPSAVLKGENNLNEWNSHIKLSYKHHLKWQTFFEFYATKYNATEYLNNINGTTYSTAYFKQLLVKPEIRTTYNFSEKSTFIGGLGWNHEALNRTDFLLNPTFNSAYAYVQYDGSLSEKTSIIVGTRFDNHNEYASQFSPKIALRYKINSKIALKSSIGYGFKAPDFRQLYFDFTNTTVGYTVLGYNAVQTAIPKLNAQGLIALILIPIADFNNELKPESSIGINFGIDFKASNKLKFNVNLFRNTITNLIDTQAIAKKTNGQNVFSYHNINNVHTQGIEVSSSWKPSLQLKISGGYQLLFAKDKSAVSAFKNGDVFARITPSSPSFQLQKNDYFGLYNRSRHMANLKMFYNFLSIDMDANIRATYRSKYGLYDSNANNYLDIYDTFVSGYTMIDIAVNKKIYTKYTVSFGVDNLFNFTDTQNIQHIAGRLFYTKINIQF